MADKTLEQRLAALERELADSKEREAKAITRAESLKSELKQTRAAFSDHKASSARAMGALNSMQDLVELRRNGGNPYDLGDDETPREAKERLMKATVMTKDGRRHYFIEKAAHVSENGQHPVYHEGNQVISLPADQVPSITWLPVEVAGRDAKTGKLILVPKGAVKAQQEAPDEPGEQLAGEGELKTNTQINAQRTAQRERTAGLGPGAPQRPSDTNVG